MLLAFAAALIAAAPAPGSIRQVDCGASLPADLAERERFTCHRLAVPRDHMRPDQGVFELAVIVRRPRRADPSLAPVLTIHGGPGGGVRTTRTAMNLLNDLLPGATMVFINQRGAFGDSEPQPCPEGAPGFVQNLADDKPWAETVKWERDAYLTCRERALAAGINLTNFGTSVTTEDTEMLRRALSITQWNVFTGSYGSAVIMDLAAAYPQTLRSVVMFGVTRPEDMPEPDGDLELVIGRRNALCRAQPDCAARHPDLLTAYRATVADLDARPVALTVPARGLQDDRFVLNGREFEYLVESLSGDAAKMARLPELLAAAGKRDEAALVALVLGETARADQQQLFGRAAVHCRDKKRYHRKAREREKDRGYYLGQLPDVCPSWAPLGPVRRIPVDTPVPFLMLVGELDPGTPSDNAFTAQRRLGRNAQVMTFPAESHVVGAYGCTRAITEAFFRDPRAPVAEQCGGRLATAPSR